MRLLQFWLLIRGWSRVQALPCSSCHLSKALNLFCSWSAVTWLTLCSDPKHLSWDMWRKALHCALMYFVMWQIKASTKHRCCRPSSAPCSGSPQQIIQSAYFWIGAGFALDVLPEATLPFYPSLRPGLRVQESNPVCGNENTGWEHIWMQMIMVFF